MLNKVTFRSAACPPRGSLSFSKRGYTAGRAIIRKMAPMSSMLLQGSLWSLCSSYLWAPCYFICPLPPRVHELTLITPLSTCSRAGLEKEKIPNVPPLVTGCPSELCEACASPPLPCLCLPARHHPCSRQGGTLGSLLIDIAGNSVGPARCGHTNQHTVGVH